MNRKKATMQWLASGFLFLLGLAAITEYGLANSQKPMLNSPTYQAVRQVSVFNVSPNDAVKLFPRL